MRGHRKLWAIGSLVIGLLQAWDSNALDAGALARLIALAAVVAPVVAIAAADRFAVRVATLVAAAALLVWVRAVTPISTNALHLALFVPALYILFVSRLAGRQAA